MPFSACCGLRCSSVENPAAGSLETGLYPIWGMSWSHSAGLLSLRSGPLRSRLLPLLTQGGATEPLEGGFLALPVDTVLAGRFVVREVCVTEGHRNVYLAEDLVPSRRCAMCSTVTADADEIFCSACGADLAEADNTATRYMVSEEDNDRAIRCERQLLAMQLTHPGLLLPVAVLEATHRDGVRIYRVMPEFAPRRLQSLSRPIDEATVVRWGTDLAEAMAFLHQHQVALGAVDAAHIAVDGQRALWTGLNDVTIIPPEQRAANHETFVADVKALARLLVGMLTPGSSGEADARISGSLRQLLTQTLDRVSDVRAVALASGLRAIQLEARPSGASSLRVGYRTDVGRARELNEDSALVLDLDSGAAVDALAEMKRGLYVVADGMGGYDAGEAASGLVIQVMTQLARQGLGPSPAPGGALDSPSTHLRQWVEEANRAVHAARLSAESEMGTTVVAAVIAGALATIANVGDSRCYHIGSSGLRRVTTDHSLVERLVAVGQITRAEAESHPQRNVIYRAVGDKPEVEVDLYEQVLGGGEALMLCSDGLSGMVPDERLLQLWKTSVSPQDACDRMVAAANQAGGEDNITVIIIQASPNG